MMLLQQFLPVIVRSQVSSSSFSRTVPRMHRALEAISFPP